MPGVYTFSYNELCAQYNVSIENGRLKILVWLSRPEKCAVGRQHVNFQLPCVTLLDHCMCVVQLAECLTCLILLSL